MYCFWQIHNADVIRISFLYFSFSLNRIFFLLCLSKKALILHDPSIFLSVYTMYSWCIIDHIHFFLHLIIHSLLPFSFALRRLLLLLFLSYISIIFWFSFHSHTHAHTQEGNIDIFRSIVFRSTNGRISHAILFELFSRRFFVCLHRIATNR